MAVSDKPTCLGSGRGAAEYCVHLTNKRTSEHYRAGITRWALLSTTLQRGVQTTAGSRLPENRRIVCDARAGTKVQRESAVVQDRLGGSRLPKRPLGRSHRGGQSAAVIYSLIGTARLNGIEPFAYLRTVFERIADHPINRIDELLPWHLMPTAHIEQQAA